MGFVFKLSSINEEKPAELMTPIVFCIDENEIAPYTKEYNVLKVNGLLSEKLLNYQPKKRNLYIIDEFNKIIDNICEPILIKDFEILFDPGFQVDVLKLFIMTNRKKRIAVLWPGKCRYGKLTFAEPGYPDYKVYKIKDYDISCVT